MALVETVRLPHLDQYPLFVTLFEHVSNSTLLRDQLLRGNVEFEYTFLDASMILSRDHLFAACFRAINEMSQKRLRTRNVHSEIVFSLSPNNNIAESFKRFGISTDTTRVIALKVATDEGVKCDQVAAHLGNEVQGRSCHLTDDHLAGACDVARLRKIYKFDSKGNKPLSRAQMSNVISTITAAIALKGV